MSKQGKGQEEWPVESCPARLSRADSERLAEILLDPQGPNEALERAAARYRERYGADGAECIRLSGADAERFAEALLDPPPMTEALKRAAELHRKMVEPDGSPDEELREMFEVFGQSAELDEEGDESAPQA